MNDVLVSEELYLLDPLGKIEIVFVLKLHFLCFKIDGHVRDSGEFRTDIFNERLTRSTVNTGDGNGCLHK